MSQSNQLTFANPSLPFVRTSIHTKFTNKLSLCSSFTPNLSASLSRSILRKTHRSITHLSYESSSSPPPPPPPPPPSPPPPETSNATPSSLKMVLKWVLSDFEPNPELAAILSVYFVQGALGISRLALSFFYKDQLSLSPAQSAAMTGAAMIPWLIKPLYGFLSDTIPIFGYRRRSYLIAAGAIGSSAWLSLATFVNSPLSALSASISASLSLAMSDVVVDSIVVAHVRGMPAERSGAMQSLCWGSSAIGGLLSAYFSGSLLEKFGPRPIFALTALLPFGTALLSGLINETRVTLSSLSDLLPLAKQRNSALRSALSNRSVYLPVAFIFAWQATPSPESALFFFSTNVLGFGPEFLGRVRLASSTAALVGLWLYRTYLRKLDLKTFFYWITIVSVPLSLTQVILVTRTNLALGLSDKLFALTDSAVLMALGQIAFMPTLVLAARLCPPGVEGTLFAALMSVYNASGTTSNELGALLTKALGVTETNFDNLWLLVVICSFSSLLALPLLKFMDNAPPDVPTDGFENTDSPTDYVDVVSSTEVVSERVVDTAPSAPSSPSAPSAPSAPSEFSPLKPE